MLFLGAQKGYPPWVVSPPQIKRRSPQLVNPHWHLWCSILLECSHQHTSLFCAHTHTSDGICWCSLAMQPRKLEGSMVDLCSSLDGKDRLLLALLKFNDVSGSPSWTHPEGTMTFHDAFLVQSWRNPCSNGSGYHHQRTLSSTQMGSIKMITSSLSDAWHMIQWLDIAFAHRVNTVCSSQGDANELELDKVLYFLSKETPWPVQMPPSRCLHHERTINFTSRCQCIRAGQGTSLARKHHGQLKCHQADACIMSVQSIFQIGLMIMLCIMSVYPAKQKRWPVQMPPNRCLHHERVWQCEADVG